MSPMEGRDKGMLRHMRLKCIYALLAALTLTLPLAAHIAQAQELRVSVHHAVIGPVIQKLADGRKIMVYIDVYYPDKLYYQGPERGLGTVNFSIKTNWTGPWNGIISVVVVDPGYKVDPTTFKPVNYDNAWAEGGAILGSGDIHYAGENPVRGQSANATVVIRPHIRYFNAKDGSMINAQYFFKVRLAFFKPSGGKVLGGDVLVYTDPSNAPKVSIYVNHKPITEHVEKDAGGPDLRIVATSLSAAAVVVALYVGIDAILERRRSRSRGS